jgi:hypothetical protein
METSLSKGLASDRGAHGRIEEYMSDGDDGHPANHVADANPPLTGTEARITEAPRHGWLGVDSSTRYLPT